MGAVATFNYSTWIARYPEFSSVLSAMASQYFTEATLYHDNSGVGPVQDPGQQLVLLNMITAHIAALNALDANNNPVNPLVGRITTANEGSVSVTVDGNYAPGSASWFAQTKYGAAYWEATAGYRTMQYRTGPYTRMRMWW